MLKYLPILKKFLLLREIPEDILTSFLKNSNFLELKKKNLLYVKGSTDNKVYFIIKGLARRYNVVGNKEVTELFYAEGDFVANIDFIFLDGSSRSTVECMSACKVISFSSDFLFRELRTNNELQFKMYKALSTYNKRLDERIRLLTNFPTKKLSYLRFREIYGSIVDSFPNKDVASYLGISPESMTRIKKQIKMDFVVPEKDEKISMY